MVGPQWDPAQYLTYAEERSRPFADLLARVHATAPRRVVDLGCGTGRLTRVLADRWPTARVLGIDSSPEMIGRTGQVALPGRLDFRLGDLREWRVGGPVDVLLSNAAVQWVPEHLELFPRWVAAVAPGGWFAFQVPRNVDAPSHRLLAELQESRWRGRVGAAARPDTVAEPVRYVELLASLGCRVDAWETTYLHLLPGDDAVLEWMKGTALRPVLSALDDEEKTEFLDAYRRALRAAYPRRPHGTLFPFRRLFVAARRADTGADAPIP
jgi:trans-aconitate 2-methyltransferase